MNVGLRAIDPLIARYWIVPFQPGPLIMLSLDTCSVEVSVVMDLQHQRLGLLLPLVFFVVMFVD